MQGRAFVWLIFTSLVLLQPVDMTGQDDAGSAGTSAKTSVAAPAEWKARDVWALKFQGNQTFEAATLQRGLSLDALTQAQANPETPVQEFLKLVGQRLEYGYRNSGFHDVAVEVAAQGNRTDTAATLKIVEGPRSTNGPIQVTGQQAIDANLLKAFLTQPQPKNAADKVVSRTPSGRPVLVASGSNLKSSHGHGDKKAELEDPVWETDEPTPFAQPFHDSLKTAVKSALEQQGFYDTQFEISLDPQTQGGKTQTTLTIKIQDEGKPARIADVEFSGLEKHSPEELLEYLEVKRGDLVTQALQSRLTAKLLASGRFLTARLWTTTPIAPSAPITLNVDVREYDRAPKLGEELTARQKTMLKFADWLSQWHTGETDFVVNARGQIPSVSAYADDCQLQAICSPQDGLFIKLAAQRGEKRVVDHTVMLTSSGCGLLNALQKRCWLQDKVTVNIIQSISWVGTPRSDDPNRRFSLGLNAGFNSSAPKGNPVSAHVSMNPAAALDMIHPDLGADVSEDDKQLTIAMKDDGSNCRLLINKSTGALIQVNVEFAQGQLELTTQPSALRQRVASLELDSWQNVCDKDQPIATAVSFLLDQCATACDASDQKPLQLVMRTLKNPSVLAKLDQDWTDDAGAFVIPAAGPGVQWTDPQQLMLLLCKSLLPSGSVCHQLQHATTLARGGFHKPFQRLVHHVATDDDVGPLETLLVAWLVPGARKPLADAGLKRLTAKNFEKDLQAIFARPCVAQDVTAGLRESLAKMSPKDTRLLADWVSAFLQKEDQPKVDVLPFLETLQRDTSSPQAFTALWPYGIREVVEGKLREFAGPSPAKTPATLTGRKSLLDDGEPNSDTKKKRNSADDALELPDAFKYESVFDKLKKKKKR